MIQSRRLRQIAAAAAAWAALMLAHDAAAYYSVTVKLKVELPPGVKGSDVTVETGSPAYPDHYQLNDKGEVEFKTSGYDNDLSVTIKGPNIYARKLVWVESDQRKVDITFSADQFTTIDGYYDPDKVFEKGKAAATAGNSAGVNAAADELEQGAKAVERTMAELREVTANILRKELQGLPPGFIDDFLRDYDRARTPEDRKKVLERYRNSATLKAPDSITTEEFRKGRDRFFKFVEDQKPDTDFGLRYRREELERAAKARAYADQLRQLPVAPPGHGAVPQPAGTPPKFPGDTTPGVPGSPTQYAFMQGRDYWAQFGAGASFIDTKEIGYGTPLNGTMPAGGYLAHTDSSGTGYRLAGDFGVPVTDWNSVVGHVAYSYVQFEGSGFVPIGAQDVGLTYFDTAPNGSKGLNLAATGSYTSVHGNLAKYDVDLTYRLDANHLFNCDHSWLHYDIGFGLGYRRFDFSYMAKQTSPTFDGIHSKAWINSTTNFIGPRIDSSVSFTPSEFTPVKFEIQGYVIPGFRWGDGTAKQKSFCNLCGADEQKLKIAVKRSHSGFGVAAGLNARVGVNLTDGLSLALEGGWEYTNAVNTWKIPTSPDDAPADLATDPVKNGYVGVNLRLRF